MFIRYKICTNIKPAIIFFCFAAVITLPLLANNKWKSKFPKSLTVISDTVPSKHFDSLHLKKIAADSLKNQSSVSKNSTDTLINDSIKRVTVDTLMLSKDSIDAPVNYAAADSGVLLVPGKQFVLYGKANTDYKDIKLDANTIQYDQQSHIITAFGGTDTAKDNPLNKPKFTQAGSQSIMDTVIYNLKSSKGITKNTYYKEGEMFVNSETVKKVDKDVVYAFRGRFTTCNLDTPHFDIRARKIKIINNKIAISGPAFPEFEGVPIPIPIPFGIYPLNRGRHSGILPPRFTNSQTFGLGLEGLGFYKVIDDDWDVTTQADLYSYGGFKLDVNPKYYKRYKYRGSFTISTQHTKQINTAPYSKEEFTTSNTYNLTWNHSSDSKARPGTSFSASVNAGSTQYNRYLTDNAIANYNNNLASNVSYNKTWDEGKYNLNASLSESQNSVSRLINLNAPTVAFTVSTIYPFQNKNQAGSSKWYQKLGIGYTGNLLNVINFYDSSITFKRLLDTIQWGADHRIPITLSLPPLGPFIISPSVSYEERWFAQKILYNYSYSKFKVDTSIERGFYAAREVTFGLNTSTRIFGTYNFKHSSGILAIRHEVDPFIGVSYKPDLVSQFYQNIRTTSGDTVRISQLQGNVLGGFSETKFGGLNFGINNLLEMKTRNRKDSTGADSVKKIRLLDNLSITSGYNLIADSLNWQPISIRAGSSLFNKVNISAGATINPYQEDSATHMSKLLWKQGKLGNLEAGNLSLSTSFQSKSKDKRSDNDRLTTDETLTPDEQQQELQYVRNNPGQFVDFNIPWSVQLSFSLSYSHTLSPDLVHFISQLNSNVNVNGDLSISPKWKLGGGIFYDFRTEKIAATSIYLTRDMHCWQMVIDVNVGRYKSFTITLNPKSGILRDLHINKHFLQQ